MCIDKCLHLSYLWSINGLWQPIVLTALRGQTLLHLWFWLALNMYVFKYLVAYVTCFKLKHHTCAIIIIVVLIAVVSVTCSVWVDFLTTIFLNAIKPWSLWSLSLAGSVPDISATFPQLKSGLQMFYINSYTLPLPLAITM